MSDFQTHYEEFKVHGKDLVDKVKSLIHEGNIRRIFVKDQNGVTFLEIPLTVAAVGVLAAPVLAAVGALAALVADFTIQVEKAHPEAAEKNEEAGSPPDEKPPSSPEI
jgi:hypothetical protein